MHFRQLILRSLGVGLFAGIVLSFLQLFGVTPIVLQAEQFEELEPAVVTQAHADHGHSHDHDGSSWQPEDGVERTAFTALSNVFVAMGFAAVILGLMNIYQSVVGTVSVTRGLLWGGAGFMAFFLAPSLGLPPEIPGAQAAELSSRQYWWVLTAACTLVGIGSVVILHGWQKIFGAVLIVLPHVIGAPQLKGPMFGHSDENVVAQLTALHHQFIVASGITNLIFWLVLGMACAWCISRFHGHGDKA